MIVIEPQKVERRIILSALADSAVFEQVEQPVEADRGAPEGREIKCTSHVMSSIEQH
jgi:hypothetical protein